MNGGPVISIEQLRQAVEAYRRAHGRYPTRHSLEPATYGARWNWFEIDKALRRETAGWQGGQP